MIGSSENRISYNGNGIATEFAYNFIILEKSDIKVLHVAADGTEQLLTKDYYVDMEKSVVLYPGYAPGAEIPEQDRPPVLPVGERLVIYREVPITQASALDKHWPFNVIENGLDKLTIICQQIWDRLQRSFYVSESTSTNFDSKVPIEAGKTFRVKDDGTGFEVTEDPGKVIDGATALLKQTTEQAEFAKEQADASSQSAVNAQNAANVAEKIATDLGLVDEAVQTAVASATTASNKADVATAKADIATTKASEASTSATTATAKADLANTSATNAAQSYANADAIATQLTEYLTTKETLTAPAVDKTLLIEGAAADSKVVGELKSDLSDIALEIVGVNIFNSADTESGKYINTSGAIATASGFYVSKPYKVYPNATYEIALALGSDSFLSFAFYDESGQYISDSTSPRKTVYTAPSNARTARVSGDTAKVSSQSLICIALPTVSNNAENKYVAAINGDNLFNASNTTDGKSLNASGLEVSNSAAYISEYIPVIPNGIYELALAIGNDTFANIVVYDKNKAVVQVVDGVTKVATITSSGYFARLCGLLEKKSEQTFKYINPCNEEIDTKYTNAVNALIGKDLFVLANTEQGKFLNNFGNETTNSAGYISEYIRVIPNATYVMLAGVHSSGAINAVIYDKYKNKLANGIIDGLTTMFVIPSDGAFVRLNGILGNIANQSFYLVYYNLENVCAGKTCVCYGDSLTEYDGKPFTAGVHQGEICVGFESYMRKDLKMSKVANRGGSGMTTPEILERIKTWAEVASYDYMTLMSGDNDDRLDVPIGTLAPIGSTFDTTTVYGALQEAVEYCLDLNPLLRIVIMTEPIGWTGRTVDGVQKLVRVQEIYPQAYRNVAKLYGLPLIDLWANSGINEFNRNQLYADVSDATNTSYMYHPNNNGWERLSQLICMAFRHF